MVPKFFVYGEDGLTLKFLKEKLEDILVKLDRSRPDDCIIYYRPSFGREKHYGEFDAIIITPKNAYLIESKWDGSNNLSSGLGRNQSLRHEILGWYQRNWRGGNDDEWNAFCDERQADFQIKFKGKYIPKTHSHGKETKLSKNLRTVLEDIGNRTVHDVLIVFYTDEKPEIHQKDFEVLSFQYQPTHGLHIELS